MHSFGTTPLAGLSSFGSRTVRDGVREVPLEPMIYHVVVAIREILQMMTEGPLVTRGVIGDQSGEKINLLMYLENRTLYILEGVILDVPKVSMEEFSTQPTPGGDTGMLPGKGELLGRGAGLVGHNQLRTTPGAKGVVLRD